MTNERKVSIKTVTVLSDRLPQPSGVDGRVLTERGGVIEWEDTPKELPDLSGDDGKVLTERAGAVHWEAPTDLDDKVRATSADTTPSYLEGKLSAGSNISLSVVDPGGDEKIQIAATVPSGADENVKASGTDTTPGKLTDKLAAGDGISISLLGSGNEQVEISASGEPAQTGLTVTVSTSGSDTPSEDRPAKLYSGDYSAFPFATIQAALDALPRTIRATTYVNIAAGTYAGFDASGFHILGSLSVNGNVTVLDTGTGTSSSGDKILNDTSKSWTPDAFIGKFLHLSSEQWPIIDNDATSITIGGRSASLAGGYPYSIREPSVILSSGISINKFISGSITLRNMTVNEDLQCNLASVYAQSVIVNGLIQGIDAKDISLDRVCSVNGFAGIVIDRVDRISFNRCLVYGPSLNACQLRNVQEIGYFFITSMNCADGDGFYLSNVMGPNGAPMLIEAIGNSKNGLRLVNGSRIGGTAGIWGMMGSGNTLHGVALESFSELIFSQAVLTPTLTGSSGDLTVDKGAGTKTWSTDFASDGSFVINANLFCRVERKD